MLKNTYAQYTDKPNVNIFYVACLCVGQSRL